MNSSESETEYSDIMDRFTPTTSVQHSDSVPPGKSINFMDYMLSHVDIARSPQPYIKFPAHQIGQKKRS